jgi:acetamidase/formamidase
MAQRTTEPPAAQYVVTDTHNDFDRALKPVATVESGEVVTFDCPGPPLPPRATVDDLSAIDFSHPHTITGPVAVEGAEPGDAIAIDILQLELPNPYGHCLFVPGVGLLPDEFDESYVHSFEFRDGFAELRPGVQVPIEPFCGIMGLAPAEPGPHPTIPPRRVGGNLDVRDLMVGAQLVLPVEVEGGLFSCGDGHAAQGDGEVCVTAIETAIRPTLRLTLLKGAAPKSPRLTAPPRTDPRATKGWFAISAPGEDLFEGAREAVREMIDHLVSERGLSRSEAYVLCSVAVDLRISEVVNWPNYVVTAYLPLGVFV